MVKNIFLWLIIAAILMSFFQNFGPSEPDKMINYSTFVEDVQRGDVESIVVKGSVIEGLRKDRTAFKTTRPAVSDDGLMGDLLDNRVDVVGQDPEQQSLWSQLLVASFPILLILAIFMFFMRQMQGGAGGRGGPMGFGKSKARLLAPDQINTTFIDVAGVDEAKEEVHELVDFLRDPTRFQRLGGRIPQGVLMVGPPGTGKTLLAKAIAGEAKVPFFSIAGSDFVEMFVGVGASRVRDMFEQAKKQAPCIIFIDEIDAVGRHRGAGHGGGNDEREQTLNQLLVEMDGFSANEGVILLAATNRPDVLDPALKRPGRFDRQVQVPNPDIKGREKILSVHARKSPLGPDVDLRIIARGTPGFSGADLANLVNEAALTAARTGKRFVTMEDFEFAKDKVMMGAERRSMVLTDEQKEHTAYHEAGHAIVGLNLEKCDPVYKATIIPRGGALGMVVSLPEIERLSWHKNECKQKLAMTMAGKAAEILKWGEEDVSNGPSGDIQQASSLARAMVMRWGMSDKIGDIDYQAAHEGYAGGNIGGFSISTKTKELIEQEVKKLIDDGYTLALSILKKKKKEFERLAQGLLEYETLTGDEINKIIKGQKLTSEDEDVKKEAKPSLAAVPKTSKKPRKSSESDDKTEK